MTNTKLGMYGKTDLLYPALPNS